MARTHRLALLGAALVLSAGTGTAQARHGADDPAAHDHGALRRGADDRRPAATVARHVRRHHEAERHRHGRRHSEAERHRHGRGSDDVAGDDKR